MVIRTKAIVKRIDRLSPTVVNIYFKPETSCSFKAGQFVIIQVEIDGKPVRRSYSIASSPEEELLQLCIKKVGGGKVSPFLHELEIGHEILLIGPAGHFIVTNKESPLVLIGSGTGIAPLRSIVLDEFGKRKILLVSGQRNESEEIFGEEFRELQSKNMNFNYITVFSRQTNKLEGHIQDHLDDYIVQDADYFICGLKEMVLDTVKKLTERNIPRSNIHFERFD